MITTVVQRWRARRAAYRPAGEPIATRDYEVSRIARGVAKPFVEAHHYSGSFCAERMSFGLHRHGVLVGACVFSEPAGPAVLRAAFGNAADLGVELGRLVLLDDVPANGESWFIARCFEHLVKEGVAGVVSFSDPVARTDGAGRVTFPGHIGTIYQATNAIYTGRTRRETKWLLPDGTFLENRSTSKLRTGERSAGSARRRLELFGAAPLRAGDDASAWVARWRARLCRPLAHEGNHRYLFGLDRALRREIERSPRRAPYPKIHAPEAA